MFEYFPDNYSWSLAVMLALQCGGVDWAAAIFKTASGRASRGARQDERQGAAVARANNHG